MISNLESIENLSGIARHKARPFESKSVPNSKVDAMLNAGWTVSNVGKNTTRLQKQKKIGPQLEDRVWILFYKMRFPLLSHHGGGKVLVGSGEQSPTTQIDVFAMDDEVAVAVECKAAERVTRRSQFQEELGKHNLARDPIQTAIRKQFPQETKRHLVLAMFLENIALSDNDKERAKQANVILFDERDLSYYEQLVSHLGPAARYQFLADLLPNKSIPGLSIRVPAIKTKMGGSNCYTFSIIPDYLLKIAYVSHRAKGKASDVDAYQRMLNKARLRTIRKYVAEDGIFPTNIVVNFEKGRLQFEKIQQEGDSTDNGIAGWLKLKSAYRSAWVIDGQHRLFAYSGMEEAHKAKLCVLAFEGLDPAEQASLFIDINARQKRVKQSLLEELYAELHWSAEQDSVRVSAIVSKAVQVLGEDKISPFYGRIQTADSNRSPLRCVSLNSIFKALEKASFFIVKEKNDKVLEFGPFWTNENQSTLDRTVAVINMWFDKIRAAVPDWWDKGQDIGGGLAMNDGVVACIMVLRSVCQHLQESKLLHLSNEELLDVLTPFANALAAYLASLTEEKRRSFREFRGGQGQIARMRICQAGVRTAIPSFNPPGLDDYLDREKLQTNQNAKAAMDRIETTLKKTVVEELKAEFGSAELDWWMQGVPTPIRKRVTERFEDDKGERGKKENYFDLLDYFKIAVEQWKVFEPLFAFEKSGKKEARLGWIEKLNKYRNAVAHPSSGLTLSLEELSEIESYERLLTERLKKADTSASVADMDVTDQQLELA